jgi:hypothetical protein
MSGEISYDLVMKEDMQFIEGAFRLCFGEWQVFIFRKSPIQNTEIAAFTWSSGVTGIVVSAPQTLQLSKQVVEQLMADRFGVSAWEEVRGPDSMQLR